MRDQVARHLERARLAARSTVVGTVTEVAPVVTALARTMEKIHRDRGIAIDIDAPRAGALSRRAAGPRGDGRQSGRQCLQMGAVAGRRSRSSPSGPTRRRRDRALRIVVDDDGPGLTPPSASRSARRGRRLDETKPGSGPRAVDRGRACAALWRRARRSAPRRSAACVPSWCCRRPSHGCMRAPPPSAGRVGEGANLQIGVSP